MPDIAYNPIAHNDEFEEDYALKSHSDPHPVATISVGRGMIGLLLIFIFLNMMLAIANGYYSMRIMNLLQGYEEKPLSSLPRIDPFNGQYRTQPLAGNYEFFCTDCGDIPDSILVIPGY